ncbi:MAG: 30S ribosomal protein S17 [Candidatus Yanofskybacteria bacterium]|nr:30S ribosomal protein S17 [Candidatus Yanofskybacteria bacterium]
MDQKDKTQRILKGVVVSDKMQKTIVVEVSRLRKHPKYKKYFKISKKYKVHDEQNEYHTGDKVLIQETRPLSKDKRFKVYSGVSK